MARSQDTRGLSLEPDSDTLAPSPLRVGQVGIPGVRPPTACSSPTEATGRWSQSRGVAVSSTPVVSLVPHSCFVSGSPALSTLTGLRRVSLDKRTAPQVAAPARLSTQPSGPSTQPPDTLRSSSVGPAAPVFTWKHPWDLLHVRRL